MKKNTLKKISIATLVLIIIAVVGVLFTTQYMTKNVQHYEYASTAATHYICPMHPDITSEERGNCPLCKMDLVPALIHTSYTQAQEIMQNMPNEKMRPPEATPVFTPQQIPLHRELHIEGVIARDTRAAWNIATNVTGRITDIFVHYNYERVRKNQALLRIYAPDILAAQSEFLLLAKDSTAYQNELQQSREKLLFMGMQKKDIDKLLRTQKMSEPYVTTYAERDGYIVSADMRTEVSVQQNMQTPARNSARTQINLRTGQYVQLGQTLLNFYASGQRVAYFSLPAEAIPYVKKGMPIVLYNSQMPTRKISAHVGLLQSEQSAPSGGRALANVYLASDIFDVGTLVEADIKIDNPPMWWLPKTAVEYVGGRDVVWKWEAQKFVPMGVQKIVEQGDSVAVSTPMQDWIIAKRPAYLRDAESLIAMP